MIGTRHRALPWLAFGICAVALISGCGANTSAVATCATSDGAYLSIAQLGGSFEVIVDQRFTASPATNHHQSVGTPSPQVSDWISGRLTGWIADIAVNGPDRPAQDALARSLGDTVGKWPLVPLSGPVVIHNPGVLEVYQTNDVFGSIAGAEDYFSDLSQSAKEAESVSITVGTAIKPPAVPVEISGGDQSFGDQTPEWVDPTVGITERYVSFGVRIGVTVVQLTVQGGSHVSLTQALVLLNETMAHWASSCHANPPLMTAS
jgi:hypothetical protein